MDPLTEELRIASTPPADPAAFGTWLELGDALRLLTADAQRDDIVIYAVLPYTFLHLLLIPAALADDPDFADLMEWDGNAASSWGITLGLNPLTATVSSALEHSRSKVLARGEQLVFDRDFEGRLGGKDYIEVLQKFAHLSELHFVPERNAYCRIDARGDVDEAVRIRRTDSKSGGLGGTVVTVRRDVLDEYMAFTESVAVRTFDFTRFRPNAFAGWSHPASPVVRRDGDIEYRSVLEPGHASYARGVQIVRPRLTKVEAAARKQEQWSGGERREYVSFIAFDWKNEVVREVSTDPNATSNYFTVSDLPFELSPAFFRPEVLSKYKADSEKYRLQERSVSCRSAWSLQNYDVNEAGQVHTYIVYLRNLPYAEQLHWKAYNEAPKAPISTRAFKRDFEGSWEVEEEPLERLKRVAREMGRERLPWWTLRGEQLPDKVHYPVTASVDEWADELLHLDQLIVEGFEEKWLRNQAKLLGRNPEAGWRSLKLVEECLVGLGRETDQARAITAPLQEVHSLRSKVKGHASGTETTEIRRRAIAESGSLKEHFRKLCRECDESFEQVREAFKMWTPQS